MYLTPDLVASLETTYGAPACFRAMAPFAEREFRLLEYVGRKRRAHDVTLLIRGRDGRFAVIRKPSYPPEVFRPPSGGVEPEESFEAGASREALEETGLAISLARYVARIDASFSHAGAVARWTTHIFLAETLDTALAPTDLHEIAEARWATVDELVERYRPAMLRIGSAGMRYRVELQDLALRALGAADPKPLPGLALIRQCAC